MADPLRLLLRRCRVPGLQIVLLLVCSIPAMSGGTAFAADLDCADFGTREAANRELDRSISEYGRDIHNLDADGDGKACERNGSAMIWSPVAAALGVLAGYLLSPHDGEQDAADTMGHGVVAVFVGLFLGWLLPGILPRGWTVAAFALSVGAAASLLEYRLASAGRTAKLR